MHRLRLIAAAVVVLAAATAEARPRPAGRAIGSPFSSNKTFGLGLELGNVEGLTGKLWLGDSNALDFGLGWLYDFGPSGFNIYADYLWHPFSLTSQPAFELPFYIGVGGRFWSWDNSNGVDAFGIRVPIGLSFDLNNVPIDIFVQVVPTIDFFRNYNRHNVYFDPEVSFGVRFYFN
jgi:hypothetical protein